MPMRDQQRAYYGGNVSMHSGGSNDAYSQYSAGGGNQAFAAPQMATAKLKDSNSVHGGLSDASSTRDMAGPADGRSLRSHNEVINTPSSMMGSQNNLNTSQYLLTSPA